MATHVKHQSYSTKTHVGSWNSLLGSIHGQRCLSLKVVALRIRHACRLAPYQIRKNCGLRMRLECWDHFQRHRLQRKPPVSDPGMHHCTCDTYAPWCMSGSVTRDGGENVLGIPGACATNNFSYLTKGPWSGVCLVTSLVACAWDRIYAQWIRLVLSISMASCKTAVSPVH